MRNCRSAAFVIMMILSIFVCLEAASAGPAADIEEFPTCRYCNMSRQFYAHSRMLIVYADGSAFGSCSIHCAALNMIIQVHNTPESIWVADYFTGDLINAEEAHWVLGGDKPGVMTGRAKWAFGSKAAAETFIAGSGGALASFDDVLKAAYEDMYSDSRMIRIKKKIRKMNPY